MGVAGVVLLEDALLGGDLAALVRALGVNVPRCAVFALVLRLCFCYKLPQLRSTLLAFNDLRVCRAGYKCVRDYRLSINHPDKID